MHRALAAAAILLGASGCASGPPSLDELIRFADTRWCVPGDDFEALLRSLMKPRGEGDASTFVLGALDVSPEYRDQFGPARIEKQGPNLYMATVKVRGTWQGLPVREIFVYGQPETDNEGMGVVFDAKRADVIRAANKVGFNLPVTGRRVEPGELLDLTVDVVADGGGAALTCGT